MLKQKGVNVGSNPTPTILTWVCRIKEVYSEPATRNVRGGQCDAVPDPPHIEREITSRSTGNPWFRHVRIIACFQETPERQPRSPIK
jgi:hypothetical protein